VDGRHEGDDGCVRWLGHTPLPLGAYGKPHPSGCGFLAYGVWWFGFLSKINLIFSDNFVGGF
jgi:hypothetical protein